MSQHVVFRKSLSVGLVTLAQVLAAPIVAIVMLRLIALAWGVPFHEYFLLVSILVAALCLLMFDYHRDASLSSLVEGPRLPLLTGILLRWLLLILALLMIGYATKLSAVFSRRVLITWFALTPVPLVLVHLVLREVRRRLMADPENSRRAVFVGVNEVSLSLAARISGGREGGMRIDGFFDDRSAERLPATGPATGGSERPVRVLGKLPDLCRYVVDNGVDVIFVALPLRHVARVMQLLDELRDTTVSIYYVPDIFVFDLIQARAGDIFGIPVVALCETPFSGYRGVMKRAMDIGVAAGLLLVLLPLLILIAIAVKASSPGSVIFKQRRYGLDGREITVYKFRTMRVSEDGARVVQATRDDDRVTPIGRILRRYSLDELPQLLNVLQGRMSLIGPRPHAVAHNEEYRKLIKGYMVRHKVLPGITGLAQVNGCRGETSSIEDMQARIRFDLEYLRRWSIGLDVQILIKTALQVFGDKKAY